MPAARYWRLTGMAAHGRSDVELSELQAFESAGGGALSPVAAAPTITCSAPIVSGTVANLTDGNLATALRLDPRPPAAALVLDYGASASPDLAAVRLGSAADRSRFLARCDLQYSTDGTTWVQSAALGQFPWPGANAYTSVAAATVFDTLNAADAASSGVSISGDGRTATSGGAQLWANVRSRQAKSSGKWYLEATSLSSAGSTIAIAIGVANGSAALGPSGSAYPGADLHAVAIYTSETRAYRNGAIIGTGTNTTVQNGGVIGMALDLDAGTITWYLNGGQIWTTNSLPSGPLRVIVGAYGGASARINFGQDAFAYSPPAGFAGFGELSQGSNFEPLTLGGIEDASPLLIAGDTVGGATVAGMPPREALRDLEDFGAFRIVGTVKEKALPSNLPLRRRVQLFDQVGGRLVREAWSDAATGAYAFHGIRGDRRYFVVAFDHTESYRAVIADNLTPEPMP